MKIEQLDPNSVHILDTTDDLGRPCRMCNLTGNRRLYPTQNGFVDEKGDPVDSLHDFFGKLWLKRNKNNIVNQTHNYRNNKEAEDNQIYLKWKRAISKNSLWDKVKIFFKNLFRKDKKYYL